MDHGGPIGVHHAVRIDKLFDQRSNVISIASGNSGNTNKKLQILPKLEAPPTLPKILQLRMGAPTQLIGFDIETHDWIEREQRYTKSRIGPFEWYTSQTEEDFDYSRIVQLGWAVGMAVEKADFVKSRLVQPDGFEISPKATRFHRIKDDVARTRGQPLRSVLQEFLADVLDITAR